MNPLTLIKHANRGKEINMRIRDINRKLNVYVYSTGFTDDSYVGKEIFRGNPDPMIPREDATMLGRKDVYLNSTYFACGNKLVEDNDNYTSFSIAINRSVMLDGLYDLSVVHKRYRSGGAIDDLIHHHRINTFQRSSCILISPELSGDDLLLKKYVKPIMHGKLEVTAKKKNKFGLDYLDNIIVSEIADNNENHLLYFDRSELAKTPDSVLDQGFSAIENIISGFNSKQGPLSVPHRGTPGHYAMYSKLMTYFRNRWKILACRITGHSIDDIDTVMEDALVDRPGLYNFYFGKGYDDYVFLGSALLFNLERKFVDSLKSICSNC